MRSVEFHREAQDEFISAARYFEMQAENLGIDFIDAVEQTYRRVLKYPSSGRPFSGRAVSWYSSAGPRT